jgi:hypothetical protein
VGAADNVTLVLHLVTFFGVLRQGFANMGEEEEVEPQRREGRKGSSGEDSLGVSFALFATWRL